MMKSVSFSESYAVRKVRKPRSCKEGHGVEAFGAAIIRYIQQSERLIVVTTVLFIAGIATYLLERANLFSFADLPTWTRPTLSLIWIVATVHVGVRMLTAFASATHRAVLYAADAPRRWRQSKADKKVTDHLCKTSGLPREILSYARFRRDNHIWTRWPW